MWSILHITVTSLVVDVTPRGIIKNDLSVCERGEVCHRIIYYTLYLVEPFVRNCIGKFEFTQTRKTDFSERALALKGLQVKGNKVLQKLCTKFFDFFAN